MKKRFALLSILALALASCSTNNNSSNGTEPGNHTENSAETTPGNTETANPSTDSTTNPSTEPSTNPGTSEPAKPTEPVVKEYNIIIENDNRYAVYVDNGLETAPKGKTIRMEVEALLDGYSIKGVFVDGTELNASSDGSYSFIMPGHDVYITVTLAIEGEVTIQGGVTAVLTKGADDIYVAHDVLVPNDTTFSFYIQGTQLDSSSIDRSMTFANITFTDRTQTDKLKIAGGCKYDFFYDPARKLPCYVQRTEVVTLPNSSSSLQSLFSGSIKSENTETLLDVKSVKWTDNILGFDYSWKKYNDNKSVANIKDISGKGDADKLVYKEITGTQYKVVDTFDIGNYKADSWNMTPEHKADKNVFSGVYEISAFDQYRNKGSETDLYDVDYDKEYMSSTMAYYDVARPDFEMTDVDFAIDSAYRVQMNVQEEVTYAKTEIVSTATETGFTTTITSSRVYDATAVATNSASGHTDKYYDTYAVTLGFNKKGQIVSGDYLDTRYDSTKYEFSNGVVTTTGTGSVYRKFSFTYEYGEPGDLLQPVDVTPYFTTSIAPVIKNKNITGEGNLVSIGDVLEHGREINTDIVTLNALPATALDTWQYHVTASTNEKVTKWDSQYSQFVVSGDGSATVTVAKTVTDGVSADVAITAKAAFSVRNFYLDNGGTDLTAQEAIAYEHEDIEYKLMCMAEAQDPNYPGASGEVIPPSDVTFSFYSNGSVSDKTVSNPITDMKGITVKYVQGGKYTTKMVIDATNAAIEEDFTFYMTVNTALYADYTKNGKQYVQEPTVFKVTVYEMDKTADPSFFAGQWTCTSPASTLNLTTNKTNRLYDGNIVLGSKTYNFQWDFDNHTYAFVTSFDEGTIFAGAAYENLDMFYYVDKNTGKDTIAVYMAYETGSSTSFETELTELIGSKDDEGNITYATFTRVGA